MCGGTVRWGIRHGDLGTGEPEASGKTRGYDQSRLLAEAVCRHWDTRPVQLLDEVQDNPAQSGLQGEAARRANVLGVYDPADPELIRDRRILLIDDIHTTGATLSECVRVLRDNGADSILCLTAARTPNGRKEKKFTDSVLQLGKSTRIIKNV